MNTTLFPKETIEFTTEHHLSHHSRTTQIIYIIIVVSLIAFVALLPILMVDVSVKSTGLLKAATEVSTLKASPCLGVSRMKEQTVL